MNEYTYKAKKIEDGEWTQGSLFAGINNSFIMQNIRINPDDEHEFKVTGNRIDKDTICRYAVLGFWEHDIILHGDEVGIIRYGEYSNTHGSYDYGFYIEWLTKNAKLGYRNDFRYWVTDEDTMLIGNDIDDNVEELIKFIDRGKGED